MSTLIDTISDILPFEVSDQLAEQVQALADAAERGARKQKRTGRVEGASTDETNAINAVYQTVGAAYDEHLGMGYEEHESPGNPNRNAVLDLNYQIKKAIEAKVSEDVGVDYKVGQRVVSRGRF